MNWTLRFSRELALGCLVGAAGCGANSGVRCIETPSSTCEFGPEDVDGFEDEDACADLDDDHDGIADASDACPCFVEDMDGFEDADGCPEVDNDQDRVPDVCDDCDDVAEIYNGTCDHDGCPDQGAIPCEGGIAILERIDFAERAATLDAAQRPVLTAVATTLNANPQILEVVVVGHATQAEGLALAEARAQVVREAMIAEGVDETRLTAFGEIAADRQVAFAIVRTVDQPGSDPSYRTDCPPEPETWCTAPAAVPVSPSCRADRGAPSPR